MEQGRKGKIYAFMVADLFHEGHRLFLEKAKALGDYLVVGILTDEAAKAYKREPVIPFRERYKIIQCVKYVDEVVVQDDVDPTENLKKINPDILVHGDDWPEDYLGSEYMRKMGKKAVRTEYYEGQSSSKIIRRIKDNY